MSTTSADSTLTSTLTLTFEDDNPILKTISKVQDAKVQAAFYSRQVLNSRYEHVLDDKEVYATYKSDSKLPLFYAHYNNPSNKFQKVNPSRKPGVYYREILSTDISDTPMPTSPYDLISPLTCLKNVKVFNGSNGFGWTRDGDLCVLNVQYDYCHELYKDEWENRVYCSVIKDDQVYIRTQMSISNDSILASKGVNDDTSRKYYSKDLALKPWTIFVANVTICLYEDFGVSKIGLWPIAAKTQERTTVYVAEKTYNVKSSCTNLELINIFNGRILGMTLVTDNWQVKFHIYEWSLLIF